MIAFGRLRPYQQRLVRDVSASYQSGHSRVIMQSPTGSGKTLTCAYILSQIVRAGGNAAFLVDSRELLEQTFLEFQRAGLPVRVLDRRTRAIKGVTIAMVKTLANRLTECSRSVVAPRYIVIDECHGSVAPTYRSVIDAWPSSRVLGLTATPCRTDGVALGEVYDDLVIGPSVRELIDAGHLSDYRILAPPQSLFVEGGGSWDDQANDGLDGRVVGDAIEHYRAHGAGGRNVVMCPRVDAAQRVAEQYRQAGYSSACLYGDMPAQERRQIMRDFETGRLQVVTSCNLLVEGIDIPAVEVVQWLRPTQSLRIWLQGCGRGVRPFKGKRSALILDHVGNYQRHGLLCQPRAWTLEGGAPPVAEEGDVRTCRCEVCQVVYRVAHAACPACGHENEQRAREEKERIEAELVEIEKEAVREERKAARMEQGQARSIEELVHITAQRGGRNPWAQAALIYAGRKENGARKPTRAEYDAARRAYAALKAGGSWFG